MFVRIKCSLGNFCVLLFTSFLCAQPQPLDSLLVQGNPNDKLARKGLADLKKVTESE